MGHRTVKRVPLDFDHPLNQRWPGYLMPDPGWPTCKKCGGDGYHPMAQPIIQTFYALHLNDPERSQYAWHDKLTQDDVDHLVAEGRLSTWVRGENGERGHWEQRPRDAAEVNANSLRHLDGINRMILCEYRCKRLGLPYTCDECGGHGDIATDEQRAEYDKWEPTEPPAGDGWQLWETTSEGSPVSPVFTTAEELARWCETGATWFASERWPASQWLKTFRDDTTDAESLLVVRVPDA